MKKCCEQRCMSTKQAQLTGKQGKERNVDAPRDVRGTKQEMRLGK